MFIYNFYNIGEKKKSIVALNGTYCNNNSKAFLKIFMKFFKLSMLNNILIRNGTKIKPLVIMVCT